MVAGAGVVVAVVVVLVVAAGAGAVDWGNLYPALCVRWYHWYCLPDSNTDDTGSGDYLFMVRFFLPVLLDPDQSV